MSATTVTDSDRGLRARLAALQAAERELARWEVVVGVLADDKGRAREEGSELTILDLATIHEFGAPDANVPQRSFIRAYVDENRDTILGWQRALLAQVLRGELDVRLALERLGLRLVGGIQARISAGIEPANAPETIERKGSSKPLVDDGQLKSSITHQVRPKGGG